MGMTILDALDTLWIMGLRDEFRKGAQWLHDNMDFSKVTKEVSAFETTIRAVGGMLAAYDLSEDKLFLDKAMDLVNRCVCAYVWLMHAFVPI